MSRNQTVNQSIRRDNNLEFDEDVSSKSTKIERECKVHRFYFSGDIFGDKYQAIRMRGVAVSILSAIGSNQKRN